VDKGLKDLPGLSSPALYAVGGIWRSFARVDMEEHNYPLHVLQQYIIPRGRALRLCKVLAGLSRESLRKIKVVSKRRAEALPYGAVVLERLLDAGDIKDVVISAYGLREGCSMRGCRPKTAPRTRCWNSPWAPMSGSRACPRMRRR
jgi:exopolyphosphatase / guanosine-5'-triphosphate,3'-diphosphate pyrophosphatase